MWSQEIYEETSAFLSTASVRFPSPQTLPYLILLSLHTLLLRETGTLMINFGNTSNEHSLPDCCSHIICSCSANFSALSFDNVVHEPIHNLSNILQHSRGRSWSKLEPCSRQPECTCKLGVRCESGVRCASLVYETAISNHIALFLLTHQTKVMKYNSPETLHLF